MRVAQQHHLVARIQHSHITKSTSDVSRLLWSVRDPHSVFYNPKIDVVILFPLWNMYLAKKNIILWLDPKEPAKWKNFLDTSWKFEPNSCYCTISPFLLDYGTPFHSSAKFSKASKLLDPSALHDKSKSLSLWRITWAKWLIIC